MFDIDNFKLAKKEYISNFNSIWTKEKYKWRIIQVFQENWDLNQSDFLNMFDNLFLESKKVLDFEANKPIEVLREFILFDQNTVREMFSNLFNENVELEIRIKEFINKSNNLSSKIKANSSPAHFQDLTAISTYLWLKYPNKYYIFNHGDHEVVASKLGNSYKSFAMGSFNSLSEAYKFNDKVRKELEKDKEIVSLLKNNLEENYFLDKNLVTLTSSFIQFVLKSYQEWHPINYSPNISEQKWLELLSDDSIFYPQSLEIMKRLKDNNEMGTCTELANKYGELKNFYNVGSSSLAKRVADKTGCNVYLDEKNNKKWWPILYKGRPASFEIEGSYTWKLRDELSSALDKFNLNNVKLFTNRSTWCISVNPDKYNIEAAFNNLNTLSLNRPTNIQVGDLVYIYVLKPVQAIQYKCLVNKVNLSAEYIADSKYDLDKEINKTSKSFMEIELIEKFLEPAFNLEYLSNHEFNEPQGPFRLKPETIQYLNLLEKIQSMEEMQPDEHDGSYELARETIKSYSTMDDLSICDYHDLNLVYLMVIGTWRHGIPRKRETIERSNLPINEKERLNEILSSVWTKTKLKKYSNHEGTKPLIGMFGTGFYNFIGKTDDLSPQKFIKMCIDIIKLKEDEEIFKRCELVLNKEFRGMAAASASVVLHCLKPMTFPIFNSNMGSDNIYVYFGIKLENTKAIETYINNCRNVKKFRDENFKIKNYRLFDIAAWSINKEIQDDNRVGKIIMNKEKIKYAKNLILSGPPGTGKTYMSKIYAVAICDNKDVNALYNEETYETIVKRYLEIENEGRVNFTTFHQSYSYEEFIEGIKPVVDKETRDITYRIEEGIFKKFCENAKKDTERPYVFIIDEVNRGNISKIFGELITLIEDTKRFGKVEATSAILPYSKITFSVPDNVYIIGTMNTADRSIAFMDTALRRRFHFIEMMPDLNVLRELGADQVKDLDITTMLETINNRITFLYDREHTIGHSFFTSLQGDQATIENLGEIFQKSIIPLLQEYFYEDYEKIQLILGDNAKTKEDYKFILDTNVVARNVFKGGVEEIDLPDKTFSINKEAFFNIESYLEISNE